jgi:large subunit ribosomal protein L9
MEVILREDVEKLGYKDDLVDVKPGYGRNYLIPRGLAVMASPSAKKVREENLRQRAHREEKLKDEANKLAETLKKTVVKVGAKVGEEGKIFGSVNNIQLADALKKELGTEVDRKKITMPKENVKTVGTYQAQVELHKDVTTEFSFEVVEE